LHLSSGLDHQQKGGARDNIFKYIEVFYNRSRRHLAAGYLSPVEYEEKFKLAA
jgi:transposase InsO family protein